MCGIAGLLDLDGAPLGPEDRDILLDMINTLAHRGPDGSGVRLDGPSGLAHVRLSVIDRAGGAQPLASEDGTVAVTYNGEIFNYLELRRDLAARGWRPRPGGTAPVPRG